MSTTPADETQNAVEQSAAGDADYRSRLRELPPSAKLVAKILETDSPLSQEQLADESLLPDRTVRYALNRLEDVDLVNSRSSYQDARKQVYALDN